MDLATLSALNAERDARRAVLLVTELGTGAQRLVRESDVAADPLAADLTERLRLAKSGTVEHEGATYFVNAHVPLLKLIVIGAVHVSQALAPMAKATGLDVTIVDPRTAFATPERFPDVPVLAEWPQDALPKLGGFDRYTALACLTHDPKIDDQALVPALRSGCLYIGALGSRRTHAKRVERLIEAGIEREALDAIHAPIGIDIGAVTPAEIAVSILAEIVATLRRDRRRAP